jgi:hypothetical protein
MIDKIKELVNSIRFWIVTFGWASNYLSYVAANGFDIATLLQQLALWAGSVVAIGTVDSAMTKFGAALGNRK